MNSKNIPKCGVKRIDDYVHGILSGKIPCSSAITNGVKHFIQTLQTDGIYFDANKVKRMFRTIETQFMTADKQQIILYDFQCYIIGNTLGFYYKDSGWRVRKEVFLFMPRGVGKSFLAAILGLLMIIYPDEADKERAYVALAANTKDQAGEVFKQAKDLCRISPYANKAFDVPTSKEASEGILEFRGTNGQMFCISADTKNNEGKNLSCFIYDEIWAVDKNDKLQTSLLFSTIKRANSLAVYISTAGDNLDSLCKSMYDVYKEHLELGTLPVTKCTIIYDLEEVDQKDWDNCINNGTVAKVNPLYSKSKLTQGQYSDKLDNAKLFTEQSEEFRTKMLNMFIENSHSWIDIDTIKARCGKVNLKDYYGGQCWIGLDLSSNRDLTAVTYLFYKNGRYAFYSRSYLPQVDYEKRYNAQFWKLMYQRNQLTLTPSRTVDYNYVANDIVSMRDNYNLDVMAILYDPANSGGITPYLIDEGFHVVKHGQGKGHFSPATRQLERLIVDTEKHDIIIDDNTVTRYCFKNSELRSDHNNNVKPFKKNDNDKLTIDIVITMIQALSGFMHDANSGDVYDENDDNESFFTFKY